MGRSSSVVFGEAEEIGPVDQLSGLLEELGDQLALEEAQLGPSGMTANSPIGTPFETLTRFTALYPRIIRQRVEARIQLHAPRDLEVELWAACTVYYRFTEQEAIAAASGAAEHPRPSDLAVLKTETVGWD
ncbi:hypothetical protein MTO96_030042 [Rhipicephalus appendiculatus]